jgi:hypothetical protein
VDHTVAFDDPEETRSGLVDGLVVAVVEDEALAPAWAVEQQPCPGATATEVASSGKRRRVRL